MVSIAETLQQGNIILAERCNFRLTAPRLDCSGGAFEILNSNRRFLTQEEMHYEIEANFPLYDAAGNPMSRLLQQSSCKTTSSQFTGPDCGGNDPCKDCTAKTDIIKCRSFLVKCKATNTPGLSFHFLSDPASCLGLLSGGDITIIDFSPDEFVLTFGHQLNFVLYTPPTVTFSIFFDFTVRVKIGIVLDSKGIREAVQEKKPLKALNSFAFKNLFDGVDYPLVVFEATVGFELGVSAAIVKIGVSGGITFRAEIDFFDPYPETSGGLIRPFELLALGSTPLDWFQMTITIFIDLSVFISIGKCIANQNQEANFWNARIFLRKSTN
jgi:hypothetical protein